MGSTNNLINIFLTTVVVFFVISTVVFYYLPDHNNETLDRHPFSTITQEEQPIQIRPAATTGSHKDNNQHTFRRQSINHPQQNQQKVDSSSFSEPNYHILFSTSCSPFQNWQSMVFFYSAWKVKQRGDVIRLASGCTDKQKKDLDQFYNLHIKPMSDRFFIHYTPDYGKKYKLKYLNKPYGLLHWMESSLGYPSNSASFDNDIVMLVDPDMMLLRPLTHILDVDKVDWSTTLKEGERPYSTVTHGKPIAQLYGFGGSWLQSIKSNLTFVVGPDSPVHKVKLEDARRKYPAGPPYMATARDMYQIAKYWVQFVPKIFKVFPKFMAEMHGYSTASAHLQLPHQLANSFMVSDVEVVKEGWSFLHKTTRENVCQPDAVPSEDLPFVFHYCQRYALGRWFAGKYKTPKKFFECNHPLMREPPLDVAVKYDWFIYPNNRNGKNYTNDEFKILQNGWGLCRMISSLNEIATYYKQRYCDKPNLDKDYIYHKKEVFDAFLKGDPQWPDKLEKITG